MYKNLLWVCHYIDKKVIFSEWGLSYLVQCNIIHMDETRIQVNKEEGKKASSQSWMWSIQSGAHEDIKATFFYYSCTRGSSVSQKLLNGFTGT